MVYLPRHSRGGGPTAGSFRGNFGDYPDGSGQYSSLDDEEAVAIAIDEMLTSCGNAGQERLIGDYLKEFDIWAMQALEEESAYATDFESFKELVISDWYEGRTDKWDAVEYIWQKGFGMVAEQSGHHDSADEVGEGEGQKFAR